MPALFFLRFSSNPLFDSFIRNFFAWSLQEKTSLGKSQSEVKVQFSAVADPRPLAPLAAAGRCLAFLEKSAAENDKTQGKQGEDEGVFFWFRNDLAIDDNPNRAFRIRREHGG